MRMGLLLLLLLVCGCRDSRPNAIVLEGEGATFVEPVMRAWTTYYAEETDDLTIVEYQGKGSGAGIAAMTKQLADFGCTDAPMNRKQLEEAQSLGGPVLHIPLVVGAVVVVYNLPGELAEPLKFDGETLVDLFTGQIAFWNDPRLQALNPAVELPALAVQPVHRADPSGTTYLFVDYLAKVRPALRETLGVSNIPNWPTGVGIAQPKSDGVAGHISRTPGAIGYIELSFALENPELKIATLRNRAGRFVVPNAKSITAAAASQILVPSTNEPYNLSALTYNLTDATGEDCYPIAGISYAVLYQRQPAKKGAALVQFLRWATGPNGQKLALKRNYAPLPESLRAMIGPALNTVEFTP